MSRCSFNFEVRGERYHCDKVAGHIGDHECGSFRWRQDRVKGSRRCYYCDCRYGNLYDEERTRDHLTPKSHKKLVPEASPKRQIGNAVYCCRRCNQDKGAYNVEEYAFRSLRRFRACAQILGVRRSVRMILRVLFESRRNHE